MGILQREIGWEGSRVGCFGVLGVGISGWVVRVERV